MLITFTNKAAKEILYKADAHLANNISGGTFHKISYKLMKNHGKILQICDESKKRLIIKKLFDCKKDKEKYEKIYKIISKSKSVYPIKCSEYVNEYQAELIKYNMIDFDDIINNGIDFIKQYKPNFQLTHTLVDELQDTSENQLKFLIELQKLTNCKMIGVADIFQSIYEWRNAKPENIDEFVNTFNCKIYGLGVNFRSDIDIVNKSTNLIKHSTRKLNKNLRANSINKGIVKTIRAWNIFNEIDKIIDIYRRTNKNITILYRDRTNKMQLEYGLRKAGINYKVSDSNDIVERSSFKVLLSVLKISAGVYDIYDLEEACKGLKRLGMATINKVREKLDNNDIDQVIFEMMNQKGTKNLTIINSLRAKYKIHEKNQDSMDLLIAEFTQYIIPSFEISKDIYNFLIDICKSYKVSIQDIRDICNDFGLDNNKTELQEDDCRLILSTIHNFKGLECDTIIIPFCNWSMRPDDNTKDIIEAERRVFYVGITRAKHELYLIYSASEPRFIKELKL